MKKSVIIVGVVVFLMVGWTVFYKVIKSNGAPLGAMCAGDTDCKDLKAWCFLDKKKPDAPGFCTIDCAGGDQCPANMQCAQWQETINGSGKHISFQAACLPTES